MDSLASGSAYRTPSAAGFPSESSMPARASRPARPRVDGSHRPLRAGGGLAPVPVVLGAGYGPLGLGGESGVQSFDLDGVGSSPRIPPMQLPIIPII